MWDIFTRTGNVTLLSDIAVIVKQECCRCSQGMVLQQNRWNNVAEYSLNWAFCSIVQILGIPGYVCNRFRLLSQNSFEDVELPVRVENRRCSHGFKRKLLGTSFLSCISHISNRRVGLAKITAVLFAD